jgi:putative ABC transport system permease protein
MTDFGRVAHGEVANAPVARWRRWADDLVQDTARAARRLRRQPSFSLVAIATLALGIGANSAIFSVIHGVLLRPLPYPNADRLVTVLERKAAEDASGPSIEEDSLNEQQLAAFRSHSTSLAGAGSYAGATLVLTGQQESVRLEAARLTADVFPMLGVAPLLGRTFAPSDAVLGSGDVAVLSYTTWQRNFGGASDILGRSLTLDGRSVAVVGVMPQGFQFPEPQTRLWIPYKLAADAPERRFRTMEPMALLADGVGFRAATAEVNTVLKQLDVADGPASEFLLSRVQDELVAPVRPALLVMAVAVGLVLLIACVNVANLLLVRNAARQREMAVQVAIGAARGRLIRQGLAESGLLALLGSAVGVGIAVVGIRLVQTMGAGLPRRDVSADALLPRLDEVSMNWSVLAFTLGIAVATGLICGLLPALRRNPREMQTLREVTATSMSGFSLGRRLKLQGVLVITEIAVATILCLGGGLLIRTFLSLSQVKPGYEPKQLLTFQISAPTGSTDDARRALAEDLVARLRGLPGVQAAGFAESIPMVRTLRHMPLRLIRDARPAPPPRNLARAVAEHPDARLVSTDFLSAMGVHIVAGRGFGPGDGTGQPRVMLVNRALVRSGFLGPNPVGTQVYIIDKTPWEVIGIVEDIRQTGFAAEADPQIFLDFRQAPIAPGRGGGAYFAVRTDAPTAIAPSIRSLVRDVSPQSAVDNVAGMDQIVSQSLSKPRFFAVLLGVFAVVAVTLATIGIYGTMAYSVVRRTREIGVRRALGAHRHQVLVLILRQGLVLAGIGVVIGLVGAFALTGYLEGMLFGVKTLDPVTFIGVPLLFIAVTTAASYVPAYRAASIDPLRALRTDD